MPRKDVFISDWKPQNILVVVSCFHTSSLTAPCFPNMFAPFLDFSTYNLDSARKSESRKPNFFVFPVVRMFWKVAPRDLQWKFIKIHVSGSMISSYLHTSKNPISSHIILYPIMGGVLKNLKMQDGQTICQTMLNYAKLIWGWVKTLVPSEPQNSW